MNRIKESLNTYVCNKETLKTKIDSKIIKPHKNYLFAITSFASFALIILISAFVYLYNGEVSYVSIDINPSIVLTANRFDKVIKVEGLNDDSKEVLKNLNLKNKDISTAVNLIVDEATEQGFIDKNIEDNAVLITTYCNNSEKRNEIQTKIHNNLNNNFNNHGIKSLIIDQKLTTEDVKKANEYNVSQGKILFVKKAIAENPELKFEDLIYLPTREIAKYINGYENIDINNNSNGNCNGYGKCGNN